MSGKSIWELIKETVANWTDVNATRLGAALAFYTLLSIAPLLVVCIGIAGLIFGRAEAQEQIAAQLSNLVGPQSAEGLKSLLQHAGKPSSGITATVVGFITLLFGASGVFG